MNTNEKIATWLGMKKLTKNAYERKIDGGYKYYFLDFLHDRNQQGWIEDKLIELGYELTCEYWQGTKQWTFDIYNINQELGHGVNESKDLAFIQAVEQLIDKEKCTEE